jgi:hypothetical protein
VQFVGASVGVTTGAGAIPLLLLLPPPPQAASIPAESTAAVLLMKPVARSVIERS